jgi:hypothetical protein
MTDLLDDTGTSVSAVLGRVRSELENLLDDRLLR